MESNRPSPLFFFFFFYLDEDFLEQRSAIGQGQLRLGVALARVLVLGGWLRWRRRRRLRGGAHRCLGHVGQVKEQVEAFDQRGGHGHGRHAVHGFLLGGQKKGV